MVITVLTVSGAKVLLRESGLRATTGRVETLIYLASHPEPVTHKSVTEDFGSADRVTVWRNLKDLSKAGLAVRADLGDHVWRFWFGDPERFELQSGLRNVAIMCV